MKKHRKLLSWVFIIFWMLLIFYFSHQSKDQSIDQSVAISKVINNIIKIVVPNVEIDLYDLDNVVRKTTHFLIYFILGILIAKGLKDIGVKGNKVYYIAIIIAAIYAVSDEVHQLFVTGRGGELRDFIIDSTGAIVGIVLYKAYNWRREKFKAS